MKSVLVIGGVGMVEFKLIKQLDKEENRVKIID